MVVSVVVVGGRFETKKPSRRGWVFIAFDSVC
jgi:hypothetical protein